jgi:DoxX-like protein
MNFALWVTQILLVVVFGYSALIKGTQSTERAVQLGMTGVVNVPLPLMRFTAYCEVLGVLGLVVPYSTGVLPILTPLAAIGLGVIMVLAARIHLGLGEPATAAGNVVLWRCAFSSVNHEESRACTPEAFVRFIAFWDSKLGTSKVQES